MGSAARFCLPRRATAGLARGAPGPTPAASALRTRPNGAPPSTCRRTSAPTCWCSTPARSATWAAPSGRPAAECSTSLRSAPTCPQPRAAAPPPASASPLTERPGAGTSPGARFAVPELPEVETIVRQLAPRLEGFRIARARLAKTDVLRRVSKPRLLRTLRGNTFDEVSRRAKHAVFRLGSGHRLIVQPRMTGSVVAHEQALF